MDKKRMMFPPGKVERESTVLERVLFVDPGLGGTGLAFFDWIDTKATKKKAEQPNVVTLIRAPRNETWENQAHSICSEFAGNVHALMPETVVLEFPMVFSGSATSQASATKGDLFKLTYLIGGLGYAARIVTTHIPVLVSPIEWKGQLPKDVVDKRIADVFGGNVSYGNHISDAVGMGLAAQGLL